MRRFYAALSFLALLCGAAPVARAQTATAIHTAPIVLQGYKVKQITHYPLQMYRLFKTDENGQATAIPFQMDEINEWGDYVLPEGGKVTANTGNGIFDLQDELSFMGDDVGPIKAPTSWVGPKPQLIFEIKMALASPNPSGPQKGAVYVGIYFTGAPPLSLKNYVTFNRPAAEVVTSRYRYGFDQKNWLVARRVEMLARGSEKAPAPEFLPLLDSTTFFLRADLKYFLTVEANHRSIESELEAYKVGPVRSIVRISFHYTFLKLNFDLNMYTEVSFFSNAVYLPAILYNPLDGKKSLNAGSGFYYGMALKDNPKDFKIDTNMPPYKESGFMDFFGPKPKVEPLYWITAAGKDRMLYMEISPSKEMRAAGAIPMFYREDQASDQINERNQDKPGKLGQSPVNLALYFDMTKFTEGEHIMAFRLFFENSNDDKKLAAFKNLGKWDVAIDRVKE